MPFRTIWVLNLFIFLFIEPISTHLNAWWSGLVTFLHSMRKIICLEGTLAWIQVWLRSMTHFVSRQYLVHELKIGNIRVLSGACLVLMLPEFFGQGWPRLYDVCPVSGLPLAICQSPYPLSFALILSRRSKWGQNPTFKSLTIMRINLLSFFYLKHLNNKIESFKSKK